MNNPEVQLKLTGDGSHTLFVPTLNENYHSTHGAYAEAIHVYIEAGLKTATEKFKLVEIFEVGFGTGLNAVLAYQFSNQHLLTVNYTGIEKHPLAIDILSQLNYGEHWADEKLDDIYTTMHNVSWNEETALGANFNFKKLNGSVLEYAIPSNKYHVIFFDAFAPEKHPEMWSIGLFSRLYESLQTGGILVTYCAKGKFKRDLKAAGYEVETLPGPPGKREMVRGLKN